jgi:hypothetical protein
MEEGKVIYKTSEELSLMTQACWRTCEFVSKVTSMLRNWAVPQSSHFKTCHIS